ncbi:uncharacterized protein B0H18DRAFT_636488 [Fomitopsis serialis]|uniref:uncharacterized protein n=1 Tax=Fomitopsis serialis TaxID=139415 RepID=UPI002008B003|nr:uncharacterized protein B0H18DRAFT_636488 [Neoantrodia serialis]KAH9919406.1 hypothetical protein B0H18DRAFT_636488 [Neoantrodia serialis]
MSAASETSHVSACEETLSFVVTTGDRVSQAQFDECASFSATTTAYGAPSCLFRKPGNRVKMNVAKFKGQLIPDDPATTVLATCRAGDSLLGHAFATTWIYESSHKLDHDDSRGTAKAGWITQLVVDKSCRRRGIATELLQSLLVSEPFQNVSVLGVASSHPATCAALAKIAHVPIGALDLDFTRTHARDILARTPIYYLKGAALHGSLFGGDHPPGAVCSIFTQFHVDHEEPLGVLRTFQNANRWFLGELHEGYEFLVVVPMTATTRWPREPAFARAWSSGHLLLTRDFTSPLTRSH